MKSISYPNMFSGTRANTVEGSTATLQNIRLLLNSWRGSLLGDPYFGSNVKKYIFEQNNIILRDIIIDDLLVTLQTFIPQIKVTRKDIGLRIQDTSLYATINCINKLDSTNNLFEILLTTE